MVNGTTAVSPGLLLRGLWVSKTGGQKLVSMLASPNQKDLLVLAGLCEAGKIKPVIDRCYPLGELAEAIRYIGQGHARGKVVITINEDASPTPGPTTGFAG